MTVLTAANGELRHNGARIAKCRNFSVEIARDSLETTPVGDNDRSFTHGLRGGQGSAVVLYDPEDGPTVDLLNSILEDSPQESAVEMLMDTSTHKGLSYMAILTQVGTPVAVGEVTACSISFKVTGRIRGGF